MTMSGQEGGEKVQGPSFVVYLRVSTDRQGKSGLGLEAQRQAVARCVADRGGRIISPEYQEIESGKRNDRPELAKAIKQCRLTGATLMVAKLDRLSRNAAFLMTLKDSGVGFLAADLPEANTMTVGIMALVAQHEREAISSRTKAALAAARARGRRLGGWRAEAPEIARYQPQAVLAAKARAAAKAGELRDMLEALRGQGLSLNAMASRLNQRGILTSRGVRNGWTATAIVRMLKQIDGQDEVARNFVETGKVAIRN
jgi:DNA invertase Pin-like site-specific DNA recombinase